MALQVKRVHDAKTLMESGVRTAATGSGDAFRLPGMVNGLCFVLDVTAAATTSGDLLDVYVQTKIDGTNWVDVQRFTQVLGDGGAKRYVAKIAAGTAMTEFEIGSALGAAALRNLLGDEWRVRWVITDESTDDASFTFSVTACPM